MSVIRPRIDRRRRWGWLRTRSLGVDSRRSPAARSTATGNATAGSVHPEAAVQTVTEVHKNTSETQSDTNDYAVTQPGYTQPAHDHDWCDKAFSLETRQVQNWTRSDLDPVDHLDHAPVRDKKTKFDTTINATYGSGGISVDYRIPYIKQNVGYETEEQIKTYYRYPQRIDSHEAKCVDCDHEQISIWRMDPIASDSEAITTSYYWGEFEEYDGTDQADHTFTLLTLNRI
jgi:hypothetical protein